MGVIIRKDAAAADVVDDLILTLVAAAARGGEWQTDAEAALRATVALAEDVGTRLRAAEADLRPLRAAVQARDDEADELLGRIADEIWNLVGRPGAARDPVLTVLFPGGASAYSAGSTAEQPARMELLAELLESDLHAGIPADRAVGYAAEIRASAAALAAALEAMRAPSARVDQLSRVFGSLAVSGQIQLSRLKRTWKGRGYSEADIHAVIPDRPRKLPAEA